MNINQQTAVRRLPHVRNEARGKGRKGDGWRVAMARVQERVVAGEAEGGRESGPRARVASTQSRRVHIHDVNEPPSNV